MIDYIRLQPCICTICGEYLNVVLHIHAEKHGYNSAEEFINSGKVIFKNEDFKFTLDKLNIPYLHGELEGYKYETHAALIKSPISNDEIFNGEILTEGFKRNDCSNSFKSNLLIPKYLSNQR